MAHQIPKVAQKSLRGEWHEDYLYSKEAATAQLGLRWPSSPQDPSLLCWEQQMGKA